MPSRSRALLGGLAAHLLTVGAAGFLAAFLVVMSPGSGVDEQELDPRLAAETIHGIRQRAEGQRNVVGAFGGYLASMARGEFGFSVALNRPVAQLVSERAPVTVKLIAGGLAGAWAAALALVGLASLPQGRWFRAAAEFSSGALLALPAAVLALGIFLLDGPRSLAVGLVVFPKIFRFARNLAAEVSNRSYVLAARARGLTTMRIFFRHIFPATVPEMLALFGVSVSMAIGAAIPAEVICDIPGLGQLAWKAALGRDIPVLIVLTMLITACTAAANCFSEVAGAAWRRRPS